MSDTYGWELLAETSTRGGRQLSKADIITLIVHWTLTRNGYRCQGLDVDNVAFDGNATGTESLPEGWQNISEETAIRYTSEGRRYLLMASRVEGEVIFNMLRVLDHDVRCIRFNVTDTVRATSGPLVDMVPGYKCVVKNVQTQLIAQPGKPTRTSTQTQDPGRGREPYQTSPEPGTTPGLGVPLGPRTPLAVGRADLDPLAGMGPIPGGGLGGLVGGGNIFDPFARGRPDFAPPAGLPPGAVPPGARFDPTGPILPGRGPGGHPANRYLGEPDNDDFNPPM